MSARVVCRHGRSGFCWDEASDAERKAFDFLHAHAFQWASAGGNVCRNEAEEYATWFAGRYFRAELEDVSSHPAEHGVWLASR